jgi:hypothetical protein
LLIFSIDPSNKVFGAMNLLLLNLSDESSREQAPAVGDRAIEAVFPGPD